MPRSTAWATAMWWRWKSSATQASATCSTCASNPECASGWWSRTNGLWFTLPSPEMSKPGRQRRKKPNAVMLHGAPTDKLAEATGLSEGEREIGTESMKSTRVAEMADDLKANPPQPFDLTRKLKVFVSEVQFIELRIPNATFSSRKIKLPPNFQKFENETLRRKIESSLKIPIDLKTELDISINSYRGEEALQVTEAAIVRERKDIERAFFHDWKGRGKVILRKDKEQAALELKRLVTIIEEYHKALRALFDESRKEFREQLIGEFLELWQSAPAWPSGTEENNGQAILPPGHRKRSRFDVPKGSDSRDARVQDRLQGHFYRGPEEQRTDG